MLAIVRFPDRLPSSIIFCRDILRICLNDGFIFKDAAYTDHGMEDTSSKNDEFGLHASQLERTEVPETGMWKDGQVEGVARFDLARKQSTTAAVLLY